MTAQSKAQGSQIECALPNQDRLPLAQVEYRGGPMVGRSGVGIDDSPGDAGQMKDRLLGSFNGFFAVAIGAGGGHGTGMAQKLEGHLMGRYPDPHRRATAQGRRQGEGWENEGQGPGQNRVANCTACAEKVQ